MPLERRLKHALGGLEIWLAGVLPLHQTPPAATVVPPHPPVIPCPRGTFGSGRDSRLNRQSIHPSTWLERSITEFLGPAFCYRRTRWDGARGELLSADRSSFFFAVCVCANLHMCLCLRELDKECACVNLCVLMLSRCSPRSLVLFDSACLPRLSLLPKRHKKTTTF